MARIRTIKPSFFRDETLQDLEAEHSDLKPMLVFAGLWTVADKNGVFEWLPRTLKLDILPFLSFDLVASLVLLERFSLISRFSHDGREYGFIPKFLEHQRISGKELTSDSKYPVPPKQGSTREVPEKHPGAQEGKGVQEQEGNGLDGQVHEIASLYPRIDDAFNLPQDIAFVIAEAVARDGRDVVWVGTKAVQEATSSWPKSELKFLPSPQRFFRESNYRKPPEFWQRSSNGTEGQTSKTTARNDRSHDAINRGIGADLSSRVEAHRDERKDGTRAVSSARILKSAAGFPG